MASEVGGRGPELTKPLMEEIQSLDQRGKKKRREALVKRGMTVSAGAFFQPWLGRARFVSTGYPVASVSPLRSQHRDHRAAEGAEERARRRRLCGCR